MWHLWEGLYDGAWYYRGDGSYAMGIEVGKQENLGPEGARIAAAYVRRDQTIAPEFYALHRAPNLFARHGIERHLVQCLRESGLVPFKDQRILDVGCGSGQWLQFYTELGAAPSRIAGIDLIAARIELCRDRLPRADIHQGDASSLPWPEHSFDLVSQFTVLTSILDPDVRARVAREVLRVLKPGGIAISYDFFRRNPRNPDVKALTASELRQSFSGTGISLKLFRITLAPPLARRIVPLSWHLALILESTKIFNTHYLALIRKQD